MDQEPNLAVVPTHNSFKNVMIAVIAGVLVGLVVGGTVGYFVREPSFKRMQASVLLLGEEVTKLQDALRQKESEASADVPVKPAADELRPLYVYGNSILVPKVIDDFTTSDAIIPLGTTGKYTVKSTAYDSAHNPSMTILVSTDAIVYENFIRTGTQAITPNPNTLTPGNPLLMNGVAFCPALGSTTSCVYDPETHSATFEKNYLDDKNNPYTVWGSIRFFSVSADDIGKTAATVITRVTSKNQQLIDWAKAIAVNSKDR